jgi:hypothetical protein
MRSGTGEINRFAFRNPNGAAQLSMTTLCAGFCVVRITQEHAEELVGNARSTIRFVGDFKRRVPLSKDELRT